MRKENREAIEYTKRHRKAFRWMERKLLGYNTWRSFFHDLDKVLILYRIFDVETANIIHTRYAFHHVRSAKLKEDYREMIIDWECARFTKPDKQLNAEQTLHKLYPQLISRLTPLLRELGL